MITEMEVDRFLICIRSGQTVQLAANNAGIKLRTIYDWIQRGESGRGDSRYVRFYQKYLKAESDGALVHLGRINEASKKPEHWQASAWTLERRHGYVKREEIKQDVNVTIGNTSDALLERLSRWFAIKGFTQEEALQFADDVTDTLSEISKTPEIAGRRGQRAIIEAKAERVNTPGRSAAPSETFTEELPALPAPTAPETPPVNGNGHAANGNGHVNLKNMSANGFNGIDKWKDGNGNGFHHGS